MFWRLYKLALQYKEKIFGGKLGRVNEGYARVKHNGLYLVRDGMTTTKNNLWRAVGGNEDNVSNSSLAIYLVERFRESTIQSFMVLLYEIV